MADKGKKLQKGKGGMRMVPVHESSASPFTISEPAWIPDAQNKVPNRSSYRSYDQNDLTKAYMAVVEDGMSIRKAGLTFGIPRTTLVDRINGRVDIGVVKSGPPPLFTKEQEALLTCHIKSMAEVGYGYSRKEVLDLASDYSVSLKLRDKSHPLTVRWLRNFLKRWPQVKQAIVKRPDIAREKCTSIEAVDNHFSELGTIFSKYHLESKPHLIYNIDEKWLSTEQKQQMIISGEHCKSKAVTSEGSRLITLIGCVNAIGQQVPPFFVFPGAQMLNSLLKGATPGTSGTVSQTGLSNSEVFKMYLKEHLLKFLPARSLKDPVLILFDGNKSQVSLSLIDWAKTENIVLFVQPPNCSDQLQSLNVRCFGPFEQAWNSACSHFMEESGDCHALKSDVCHLACKIYAATLYPSNIHSAYKSCGIFPFKRHTSADAQVEVTTSTTFDISFENQSTAEDVSISIAESFLQEKEHKINKILQKASKRRNFLNEIVNGEPSSKEASVEQTKILSENYIPKAKVSKLSVTRWKKSTKSPKPDTSGTVPKTNGTVLQPIENDESLDEEDCDDADKCIVCKRFSPEFTKKPNVIIVSWGQCEKCKGWVHLSFCSPVTVIGKEDTFLCPTCFSQVIAN